MWKFSGVPNKISISVMLLTLIAFTRGESKTTFMYVMEGDVTKLNFSFPCNSSKVTLRHGYKAPFYDSTDPEPMPVSDRHELMLHKEIEDHNCFLQLKVNHVLRSDEGGYILTAYDGDGNFLDDSKIGLRVDHLPGVASCEWLEENFVDDWGTMLCKAPAGSTPGIIACYQNGIRLPPKTIPTEAGNFLQHTIWVRYSQVAFCCASLQENIIDKCECKDFIWDPSHNVNITDPCATPQDSAPPHNLGGNHEANANGIFIPTPQAIPERPSRPKIYNSPYCKLWVVIVASLVFNVIVIIVFTAVFRKTRHYTTVPAVEVQL